MFNVNVNDKEFKIDESLSIKEFSRKYFNEDGKMIQNIKLHYDTEHQNSFVL